MCVKISCGTCKINSSIISVFTGVLLYEMHDALVQLALMKIKKGIIDQDQFAVEIKFALKILRETINIFKREDEKSLIGSLAKIASGKYDNIAKMLNV